MSVWEKKREERREITDTITHTLTHTPLKNSNISNTITKSSKMTEAFATTCCICNKPIPLLTTLSNVDGVPAHKLCIEKLETGRSVPSSSQ